MFVISWQVPCDDKPWTLTMHSQEGVLAMVQNLISLGHSPSVSGTGQ